MAVSNTPFLFLTIGVIVCANLYQVHGGFHGLCYSPYTTMGVCRTPEELEEDVGLMLQHTSRIRLYSTECPDVMHGLLKKASEGQLSLLLGVWMENSQRDRTELDMLMKYLEQYPHAALEGIVIGNEVLFRGQASPEYMGYFVSEAKNRVRGLGHVVGSEVLKNVDIFSVEESPNPAVVAVSDAVGVNIHPFYDWTLPKLNDPKEMGTAAAKRFQLKLNSFRSQFPGHKIVVAEVGWPSDSDIYSGDTQSGSEMLQYHFVKAFLDTVATDPVPYYFFEFRNAEWKTAFGGSTHRGEANFGLFHANGKAKRVVDPY